MNANAFSIPSSKFPLFFWPFWKKLTSRVSSASVGGRRYAPRAKVDKIFFAHTEGSAPAAGRQLKIRRRLGESPDPITLNGPSIVTRSSSGIPAGEIGSIRSRKNGCNSSTGGAELFFKNA